MTDRGFTRKRAPSVLLVSIADWDAILWTNKQHTARALRDEGFRVFYVDSMGLRTPSFASGRDLKRIWRRLLRVGAPPRQVEDDILVWSPPALPFQSSKIARHLNRFVVSRLLKFHMRREGIGPTFIWTYSPLTLALLQLPKAPLIYHCVDDFSVQAGLDPTLIAAEETGLVVNADAVFVTSFELVKKWSERRKVFYYPNCIDPYVFESSAGEALDLSIPRPRIGFVGAIASYKLDVGLLIKVFQTNREWNLVLVGPREDQDAEISQLLSMPNVRHIGAVPHSQVPAYMRSFDVGIIPSVLSPYTRSMFPMKFFEYLAAGVPVVSTMLASLIEFRGIASVVDTEDFELAISRALQLGQTGLEDKIAAVLAENSYGVRTAKMLRDLELAGVLAPDERTANES